MDDLPTNLLLRDLPPDVLQAVLARSTFEHVDLRETMIKPNLPITFVDFPESGVVSLLQVMENGSMIEVANIGNEGMVGVTTIFNIFEIGETAFCQVEGTVYRIQVKNFLRLLRQYPILRHVCQRYTMTLLDQISRNSGCYRTHTVKQRCARWLLSSNDRCHVNKFVLTQEFLSLMLGVSRASVNVAAGALSKAACISYSRGKVHVLNRKRLEGFSCRCYDETNAYYTKTMAPVMVAL